MLKYSRNEKGEIKLHAKFPKKYLPFIPMKFVAIPKIDFQFYAKAEPQKQEYDRQHEQAERNKGLALLEIQEATAKWLDEMNFEMESGKEIEFEQWFDKIVEQENNLEVPIQVCFGLIEEHNSSDDKTIIIQKEAVSKNQNDLMLWQMKIQTTRS